MASETPLALGAARLELGGRTVWADLDLELRPGEFVAVIGPNGAGKTSLLRVLLGLERLSGGTAHIDGHPPRRGDPAIGYVPQQRSQGAGTALRGRDLVGLGVDGHRWGLALAGDERRRRVDAALAAVDGEPLAPHPLATLSGGEQQRMRIAQAIVGGPRILLCDEPLASLDLPHAAAITRLVARLNRERGLPVLFVTHDVNPVLPYVDRVLCIARGRSLVGTPAEVLTDASLSRLYGAPVQVVEVGGQIVVLGADLGGHGGAPEPVERP